MLNCRLKYKTEITEDIKKIIVGEAISYKVNPSSVVIPFSKTGKISNAKAAYEVALRKHKEVERKYNKAFLFPSLTKVIDIPNVGTQLIITVPEKLIDAYEVKNGQKELYQLNTTTEKRANEKINTKLKEFLSKQGIQVEYLDSLKKEYGDNVNAVFNSFTKTIKIAKGEERLDTLPEEVAHSITKGLGKDHLLVKKLFNLIKRTDYKSQLDPAYIDLYKGNTDALVEELAGKYIAQAIVDKYKGDPTILDTLKKIINKFLDVFRSGSISELENIDSSIKEVAKELADVVNSGELLKFSTSSLPTHPEMFSVTKDKGFSGSKYEEQLVTLSRLKSALKKRVAKLKSGNASEEIINKRQAELDELTLKIDKYKESNDIEILENLANEAVDRAETFVNILKSGNTAEKKITDFDFAFAREILERFSDRMAPGNIDRAAKLWQQLIDLQGDHILDYINEYESSEASKEDLEKPEQKQDIGGYKRWLGKLSNSNNIVARTIGSMINATQNTISIKNKESKNKIQAAVDKLRKYQEEQGLKGNDIFSIFIQEAGGTTVLTKPYTTEWYNLLAGLDYEAKKKVGTWNRETKEWVPNNIAKYSNANYRKIQKTPELKEFYDFHKGVVGDLRDKLPTKIREDFIANLRADLFDQIKRGDKTVLKGLGSAFKNIINVREVHLDDFSAAEDLKADILDPRKYQAKINPEEKSRDLGQNLLAFSQFVNSYEELSDTLPKVRLLQSHFNETKNFIKSSDPKTRVSGRETNYAKLIEDTINMQLRGEAKKDEGKIELEDTVDEDGNPVKRYVLASDIADSALKYNSLLRIGFSIPNALSNVSFGEVTNFIEASGGRFFSIKNMNDATKIFTNQTRDPESTFNKLLEKLNPLQELTDYENIEHIKTKGNMSSDSVKDVLYSPQKIGEKFIQSRTMLAVMLKEGFITSKGELTEKGDKFMKDEEAISRMSTKIKGINERLHGRYSQRSASAAQQYYLFRIASQFRKWLPAAIESRVSEKHMDSDIGEEFEGRYNTFARVVLKEVAKGNVKNALTNFLLPLISAKKALDSGKLNEMEIYNMRKNLVEAITLLSTVLLFKLWKGDDDDKEWRKKASVKFIADQLNRVSGDIQLFYSPTNLNRTLLGSTAPLSKTIGDLIEITINTQYIFYSTKDKKAYYQRGPKKGEHKFYGNIPGVIPVVKPAIDLLRHFKKDVEYIAPPN